MWPAQMKKNMTLEEALRKIDTLGKENKLLKEKLVYYKNRKTSGRKKHNAKWMAQYEDFSAFYETRLALIEIADRLGISERTAYRLKKYYEELKEVKG